MGVRRDLPAGEAVEPDVSAVRSRSVRGRRHVRLHGECPWPRSSCRRVSRPNSTETESAPSQTVTSDTDAMVALLGPTHACTIRPKGWSQTGHSRSSCGNSATLLARPPGIADSASRLSTARLIDLPHGIELTLSNVAHPAKIVGLYTHVNSSPWTAVPRTKSCPITRLTGCKATTVGWDGGNKSCTEPVGPRQLANYQRTASRGNVEINVVSNATDRSTACLEPNTSIQPSGLW